MPYLLKYIRGKEPLFYSIYKTKHSNTKKKFDFVHNFNQINNDDLQYLTKALMILSSTTNIWVKKNKDSYSVSLYSVIIVLFLFISHLILLPFTFTSLWHCPMMQNQHASMSMTMCDTATFSHSKISKKTDQHSQHNQQHHGIFVCPLCNGLAVPSPLLNLLLIFPQLTIIHLFLKRKVYQAQPPPILPLNTQLPRAPPFY